MSKFEKMVDAPAGSKFILQGNQAFALGVMHSGYHCADGYPGTPSTEIIDKSLATVQDRISVGWSVNEAVAVAVGVGRAIAGDDTLITMKTPGALQAGDTIHLENGDNMTAKFLAGKKLRQPASPSEPIF